MLILCLILKCIIYINGYHTGLHQENENVLISIQKLFDNLPKSHSKVILSLFKMM